MLYYTGASKPEAIQDNPSLSLGGFKSSTQIPNGQIHNLFPKITQSVVMTNRKAIRMIVFHNQLTTTMNNIKLYIENSEHCKFTLVPIAPGFDSECNRYFFEKVTDEQNLPYQGTLAEYTQAAPFTIPTLEAGKFIGVWIRRELDLDKFTDLDKGKDINIPCEEMIAMLQEQTAEDAVIVEDQMKFFVEWD